MQANYSYSIIKLMDLVVDYGNARKDFGDYQSEANAKKCGEAKDKIEDFIKKHLTFGLNL